MPSQPSPSNSERPPPGAARARQTRAAQAHSSSYPRERSGAASSACTCRQPGHSLANISFRAIDVGNVPKRGCCHAGNETRPLQWRTELDASPVRPCRGLCKESTTAQAQKEAIYVGMFLPSLWHRFQPLKSHAENLLAGDRPYALGPLLLICLRSLPVSRFPLLRQGENGKHWRLLPDIDCPFRKTENYST